MRLPTRGPSTRLSRLRSKCRCVRRHLRERVADSVAGGRGSVVCSLSDWLHLGGGGRADPIASRPPRPRESGVTGIDPHLQPKPDCSYRIPSFPQCSHHRGLGGTPSRRRVGCDRRRRVQGRHRIGLVFSLSRSCLRAGCPSHSLEGERPRRSCQTPASFVEECRAATSTKRVSFAWTCTPDQ